MLTMQLLHFTSDGQRYHVVIFAANGNLISFTVTCNTSQTAKKHQNAKKIYIVHYYHIALMSVHCSKRVCVCVI